MEYYIYNFWHFELLALTTRRILSLCMVMIVAQIHCHIIIVDIVNNIAFKCAWGYRTGQIVANLAIGDKGLITKNSNKFCSTQRVILIISLYFIHLFISLVPSLLRPLLWPLTSDTLNWILTSTPNMPCAIHTYLFVKHSIFKQF